MADLTLDLTDDDLQQLLSFTVDLARRAGALILEGSRAIKASQSVNQKKNAGQLLFLDWTLSAPGCRCFCAGMFL